MKRNRGWMLFLLLFSACGDDGGEIDTRSDAEKICERLDMCDALKAGISQATCIGNLEGGLTYTVREDCAECVESTSCGAIIAEACHKACGE